jgi:hypothetical protein
LARCSCFRVHESDGLSPVLAGVTEPPGLFISNLRVLLEYTLRVFLCTAHFTCDFPLELESLPDRREMDNPKVIRTGVRTDQ